MFLFKNIANTSLPRSNSC